MIIDYNSLIYILQKSELDDSGVPPIQSIYLKFISKESINEVKDTIIYHSKEGLIIAIDIDDNGKVLGIEII